MTVQTCAMPNAVAAQMSCAADYEAAAQTRIAAPTLAYIAGGSGDDVTLNLNRRAFERLHLVPRVLQDLGGATTAINLLGRTHRSPLLLAPLAYQGLVSRAAEVDTARGAAAMDCCMVVSTLSSASLEDIAASSPAPKWFQLYFLAQRDATLALLRRAESAGFEAIVVTLDAAVQIPSRRALAAGFQLPADGLLRHEPGAARTPSPASGDVFAQLRQLSVSREDLTWLLGATRLPVIAKGVMHAEDAVALRELGVAAVVVSNHGGRTVDGVCASLSVLAGIRAAVGDDYPLLFDSGVRSGADVFKALARGADAVLIGRLQVYALATAGALGVGHMLKLLLEELQLCMSLSGCRDRAAIRRAALHEEGESR